MPGLVRDPTKERVSDGDYLAVSANFSLPLPDACFGFSTPLAGPDAGGSSLKRSHRDGRKEMRLRMEKSLRQGTELRNLGDLETSSHPTSV